MQKLITKTGLTLELTNIDAVKKTGVVLDSTIKLEKMGNDIYAVLIPKKNKDIMDALGVVLGAKKPERVLIKTTIQSLEKLAVEQLVDLEWSEVKINLYISAGRNYKIYINDLPHEISKLLVPSLHKALESNVMTDAPSIALHDFKTKGEKSWECDDWYIIKKEDIDSVVLKINGVEENTPVNIKAKNRHDDLYNEGGEGYNPQT